MRAKLTVFFLGVLGIASVVLVVLALNTVFGTQYEICVQVNNLRGAIYTTLQRSTKLLGVKGGSAYQYYKKHPQALAEAKVTIAQELATFNPVSC